MKWDVDKLEGKQVAFWGSKCYDEMEGANASFHKDRKGELMRDYSRGED